MLAAGGRADRVIFSGVGKTPAEIGAALLAGIKCFNVESEPELASSMPSPGRWGCKAAISLRINPDVDARTHPYISTGMAGATSSEFPKGACSRPTAMRQACPTCA